MRIAVIADTHMPRGTRRLPDACTALIRGADAVIHAGDFTAHPVLEELRALGTPVVAVRGNQDDDAIAAELPETAELAGIAVIHDAGPAKGRLARMRRRFPDARAVVFGHSHLPLHAADGGFQIFNPGSPTERRRAPSHTMGVATVDRGRVEFELMALS
jgi:putative phosphoesterase